MEPKIKIASYSYFYRALSWQLRLSYLPCQIGSCSLYKEGHLRERKTIQLSHYKVAKPILSKLAVTRSLRFSEKAIDSILKTAVLPRSVWQETPDWDEVFHSYKTIDEIILVLVSFVDVSLNNLLARLRIRLRALLNIAQLVKIRPLSSIGKQFWSLSFFSPTTEALQAKRVQTLLNNQKYSYALGTKNFNRLANVYLFGMSIKRVLIN